MSTDHFRGGTEKVPAAYVSDEASKGEYAAQCLPPRHEVSAGWLRAVGEAMLTYIAGTAEPSDSYEAAKAAKAKLDALLAIAQDIGAYHERERICSQISETQRRFCGSGLDGDLLVHEIRAAAEGMR